MQIEAQADLAERARRLARNVTDEQTSNSLKEYANGLGDEIEKLKAQATIIKKALSRKTEEGEPIGALKPPHDGAPEI